MPEEAPGAFGIEGLTREVRRLRADVVRSLEAMSASIETRLEAVEAGICGLDKRQKELKLMSQEQYQRLSDLLDAQSGANKEEHQEVISKLDELTAIITDLQGRVGQDLQPLIDKAQANIEETRGILTNEPTPEPTPPARRK